MYGIFELRLKLFPELFDFGVDDRQTVGLIRIVTIIILMVIFSLVKRGKGLISVTIGLGQSPDASVSRLDFSAMALCCSL
jgi:hypothetical protein